MEQNLYFNATCDLVDVKHCTQYNVDPCDCTKYYECALNQMFHRPCAPGTISQVYNGGLFGCVFPNDNICQPESPWKRCNVTESRTQQLILMCGKSVTTTIGNPSINNQISKGFDLQTAMQTVVPAIVGLIGVAILVGFFIMRHRANQDRYSVPQESRYDSLHSSRRTRESIDTSSEGSNGIPESIYTISDGSIGTPERFTRDNENHLSDPYNSYQSFDTSISEYCPCETQRHNPLFGVDLNQSMPRSCEADRLDRPDTSWNTHIDELSSSTNSSYVNVLPSDPTEMPQASDADREYLDSSVSSEDSAYVFVGPLFYPYNTDKGPWHHKPIFSTKEHYCPSRV